MSIIVVIIIFLILFVEAVILSSLFYCAVRYVPFVPTEAAVVKKMIAAAHLKDGQRVVDLGCGDGRLLVEALKKKNVKATGIEVSRIIYILAKIRLWLTGKKAKLIRGNFFHFSLSDSDVIFCYLFPKVMEHLKEKFTQELKSGTTIISYSFPIKAWKPARIIRTKPHKPKNFLIYVYRTPCQMA